MVCDFFQSKEAPGEHEKKEWSGSGDVLRLCSSRTSSKSRVCTYARGTPTAKQLGECSSFHLSPPFQSLELNRKKERERERERDLSKRNRETVWRKDGEKERQESTLVSLYRDGTIKQGRIRGSLRAIILDPVVVGVLSVKGISRRQVLAWLCEGACTHIHTQTQRARQGYIGGQTSAGVTGGDLCLRYAVRQGDRSQRGRAESQGTGVSNKERQVDISVLPAHWDPFYASEQATERPNQQWRGKEG